MKEGKITGKHALLIVLLAVTSIIALLLSVSANSFIVEDKQMSDVSKQKIHQELRVQLQEKQKETITVLMQLKKEDDLDKIADLVTKKEGVVIGKYKAGDVIAATISADTVEEIAKDHSVKSISPNRVYRALLQDSVPQINAPVMWDNGYNGSGIKIAILDTGIDATHPMLQEKVIQEEVFTGEDHTYDVHGHGTHCAGIAAGRKVSSETHNGVAPGALLINAKVLNDTGYGDDVGILNAINWVIDPDGNSSTDDGADVISMSLGAPYSDPNAPLLTAIKDAVEAGVVVVVATGNCGPGCPRDSCHGYIGVETPGNSPDAISVGAVDVNNQWACFSSGGSVNGSVKPDIVAPGVNIDSSIPGGGYAALSGTSMSAPHAAGAVALVLQSNHNLTPEQVKYIIEYTSVHLGEPGKDVKYGSGLIDASKFIPPNVNKLQKYRLLFPEVVYQGEPLEIHINATFGNVVKINATITDATKTTFSVNFTNMTTYLWNATFKNTSELGEYALDVFILDSQANVTELNEKFDVIKNN
jgi:subtilisin family serine protease